MKMQLSIHSAAQCSHYEPHYEPKNFIESEAFLDVSDEFSQLDGTSHYFERQVVIVAQ